MKIVYFFILVALGSGIYRWIAINHILQHPANRPRIFWNDVMAFVIYNLPFLFWVLGIAGLFLESIAFGVFGIIAAIGSWVLVSKGLGT